MVTVSQSGVHPSLPKSGEAPVPASSMTVATLEAIICLSSLRFLCNGVLCDPRGKASPALKFPSIPAQHHLVSLFSLGAFDVSDFRDVCSHSPDGSHWIHTSFL